MNTALKEPAVHGSFSSDGLLQAVVDRTTEHYPDRRHATQAARFGIWLCLQRSGSFMEGVPEEESLFEALAAADFRPGARRFNSAAAAVLKDSFPERPQLATDGKSIVLHNGTRIDVTPILPTATQRAIAQEALRMVQGQRNSEAFQLVGAKKPETVGKWRRLFGRLPR